MIHRAARPAVRWLLAAAAGLGCMAGAWLLERDVAPVAAHTRAAARIVPVHAGAYRLQVSFYSDPPRAGSAVAFSVEPAAGMVLPAGRLQLSVTAVPGAGVNASPFRVLVQPHDDQPRGVAGNVRFPVEGQWTLRLELLGPLGRARADVPVRVEPAAPIPTWLGWLVGLVPVVGLLAFLAAQMWHTWRSGGFHID